MPKNTCDAHEIVVEDAKEFRAEIRNMVRDVQKYANTLDDRIYDLEKDKIRRESSDVELQKRDQRSDEKRDLLLKIAGVTVSIIAITISALSYFGRG